MTTRKRKGTGKRPAPNHTHIYLIKVEKLCLIFFIVFLFLFLGGYRLGNQPMEFIGLGIGVTASLIQAHINLKEE